MSLSSTTKLGDEMMEEEDIDINLDDHAEKAFLLPTIPTSVLRQLRQRGWNSNSSFFVLTSLNAVMLISSVVFFFSPLSTSICASRATMQDHWKATSYHSPILDRYTVAEITQTTNGTLYDTIPPSMPRARTGKDVDDYFFRIGTGVFPIIISSDEVRRVGKDPVTAVKVPADAGYGDDAYVAQTEVFHYLHCLDMLRKKISYDHYFKEKFEEHPEELVLHEAHVGHCLDILVQHIKCTASTDVITFNWVEGWNQPFPDFHNKHICRDFEGILEYVNANSLPVKVWQTMKSPPEGYTRIFDPGAVPREQ